MGDPIPIWRDDPDYFGVRDERRAGHVAEIRRRRWIENVVDAAIADGSYAVVIRSERR